MQQTTLDTLTRRLNELSEAGKNYIENEDLQARIQDLKSEAEELIRQKPLLAIGAGLALGYLLGRLFSRD